MFDCELFGEESALIRRGPAIYPRNMPPGARTDVPRPSQFGITDFEKLFIPTPDGESLSAFYLRANKQHARNMSSVLESLVSYLRIPLIGSSSIAAVLSGALYFKQK
ncbi:hypothetical protein K505DRAFT_95141 [Melanomma pulvis-pyrius CBS 109.77]|uniref:Uncharacterized protein n=1 Tax=Melanomma pulvis-pyrius CBS 109.77 TaxID=1314802 RepID=A0A6A6WZ64_9PLEO|nr:hypothetical protein K505DRAFT_95141 [Melanomma pulvis-pyrius CBS 109.77]